MRPSPSHCCAMGPSLSHWVGEGIYGAWTLIGADGGLGSPSMEPFGR